MLHHPSHNIGTPSLWQELEVFLLFCIPKNPVFAYHSSYILKHLSRQDLIWCIATSGSWQAHSLRYSGWPAQVPARPVLGIFVQWVSKWEYLYLPFRVYVATLSRMMYSSWFAIAVWNVNHWFPVRNHSGEVELRWGKHRAGSKTSKIWHGTGPL